MALTGNTLAATVNGYRARAAKTWYPTNGNWVADGGKAGITLSASRATTDGTTSSNNKYGQIIKVTTPSNSGISSINKLSITFYVYDRNSTKGTLYGSLRTTYTDSTSKDTDAFFRTNAIGSEASISTIGTSETKVTFTFEGTFSQNTSYYLFLYTKSTADIYGFNNTYIDTAQITYTKKSYTVKYNANGGTGAPSNQTKIYGETLKLSTTKPTRSNGSNVVEGSFDITGDANGGYFGTSTTKTTKITATSSRTDTIKYTFSKWHTVKAGTGGTDYAAGANYTANSGATLYAQWSSATTTGTTSYSNNAIGGLATPTQNKTTIATYTITFDANGGTCSTASLSSKKTRTFTFKGWAESSTATTALANTKTYTSAKTVYAVWGKTDSTASITLPTPSRTGYDFVGWATTENATSADIGIGDYTPSTDDTFYAVWKANGNIRIYVNDTNKYKMAMVYVYAPTSTSDTKPWKLAIPYLKDGSTWKIIAG